MPVEPCGQVDAKVEAVLAQSCAFTQLIVAVRGAAAVQVGASGQIVVAACVHHPLRAVLILCWEDGTAQGCMCARGQGMQSTDGWLRLGRLDASLGGWCFSLTVRAGAVLRIVIGH